MKLELLFTSYRWGNWAQGGLSDSPTSHYALEPSLKSRQFASSVYALNRLPTMVPLTEQVTWLLALDEPVASKEHWLQNHSWTCRGKGQHEKLLIICLYMPAWGKMRLKSQVETRQGPLGHVWGTAGQGCFLWWQHQGTGGHAEMCFPNWSLTSI